MLIHPMARAALSLWAVDSASRNGTPDLGKHSLPLAENLPLIFPLPVATAFNSRLDSHFQTKSSCKTGFGSQNTLSALGNIPLTSLHFCCTE
jgi:hypothetical protein